MKFSDEGLRNVFDRIRFLNEQEFECVRYDEGFYPSGVSVSETKGIKIEVVFLDKGMPKWLLTTEK